MVGKIVKLEEPGESDKQYVYWVQTSLCDRPVWLTRARDVTEFQNNYQAGVLQWLEDNGYTDNVLVPHNSECEYFEESGSEDTSTSEFI